VRDYLGNLRAIAMGRDSDPETDPDHPDRASVHLGDLLDLRAVSGVSLRNEILIRNFWDKKGNLLPLPVLNWNIFSYARFDS